MILHAVERKFTGSKIKLYLAAMYSTALILAYYGLLRVSEIAYTPSKHMIKAKDVHSANDKEKILLILYTSKTHGLESRPQEIRITSNQQNKQEKSNKKRYCPFQLTRRYLRMRGGYAHAAEQFFIFADGSPLSAADFRRLLRSVIKDLGLNDKLYDTHSLRIGRASDMMRAGYSVDTIKIGW